MIGRLFRAHGEFCASHPWEVIVALLTITACMLTVDKNNTLDASSGLGTATASAAAAGGSGSGAGSGASGAIPPSSMGGSATSSRHRPCHGWSQSCDGLEAEYNAADVILMTIVRCTAVLYCYYQFCSLHRLGSKYVLGEYCVNYITRGAHDSFWGARVLTKVVRTPLALFVPSPNYFGGPPSPKKKSWEKRKPTKQDWNVWPRF